jgi:hypothetical protein
MASYKDYLQDPNENKTYRRSYKDFLNNNTNIPENETPAKKEADITPKKSYKEVLNITDPISQEIPEEPKEDLTSPYDVNDYSMTTKVPATDPKAFFTQPKVPVKPVVKQKLTPIDYWGAGLTSIPLLGPWAKEYQDNIEATYDYVVHGKRWDKPEDDPMYKIGKSLGEDMAFVYALGPVFKWGGKYANKIIKTQAWKRIPPHVRKKIKEMWKKSDTVTEAANKVVNKTSSFLRKKGILKDKGLGTGKRIKIPTAVKEVAIPEETAISVGPQGQPAYTTSMQIKDAFRKEVTGRIKFKTQFEKQAAVYGTPEVALTDRTKKQIQSRVNRIVKKVINRIKNNQLSPEEKEFLARTNLKELYAKNPKMSSLRVQAEYLLSARKGTMPIAPEAQRYLHAMGKRPIEKFDQPITRYLSAKERATAGPMYEREILPTSVKAEITQQAGFPIGATAKIEAQTKTGESLLQQALFEAKKVTKKTKKATRLFGSLGEIRATKKLTKEGVALDKRLLNQMSKKEVAVSDTLDLQRISNIMDDGPEGLFHDEFTTPLRDMGFTLDNYKVPILTEMYSAAKQLGISPNKHKDLVRQYGEKLLTKEQLAALPKKLRVGLHQMDKWIRRGYNNLRIQANNKLLSLGKKTIAYRRDYYSHSVDLDMLAQKYGGIERVPAPVMSFFNKPTSIKAKMAFARKHGLPEDIIPDAFTGFENYLDNVANIRYASDVLSKMRGYAKELRKMKKAPSIADLLDKKADLLAHMPIMKASTEFGRKAISTTLWLHNRFVRNQIQGNFSVLVSQTLGTIQNAAIAAEKYPTTGGIRAVADYPIQAMKEVGESMYRHFINPSYESFARKFSHVYKGRVATGVEGIKATAKGSTADKITSSALNFMDRIQVSSMFNIGYKWGYKDSIKKGLGTMKAHTKGIAIGDDMASRAAAEFDKLMKPQVFSTMGGKITMPIMTIPVNNANMLVRGIGKRAVAGAKQVVKGGKEVLEGKIKKGISTAKAGAKEDLVALAQVGNMYGASVILNTATRFVMGQKKFTPMDLIPFYGPVKYGVGGALSLPVTAMKVIDGQVSPVDAAYRLAFTFVPRWGGAQIYKTTEGIKAVWRGGKFNKSGRQMFPVQGAGETARALMFGPYGTKAGGDYIQKRFKGQ